MFTYTSGITAVRRFCGSLLLLLLDSSLPSELEKHNPGKPLDERIEFDGKLFSRSISLTLPQHLTERMSDDASELKKYGCFCVTNCTFNVLLRFFCNNNNIKIFVAQCKH